MTDSTPTPLPAAQPQADPFPVVLGTVEHVLAGTALAPYRKLIWQLAVPFVTLLLASVDGHLTWITILTAVVASLGVLAVYRAPAQDARWKAAKTIAAFVAAGLQALVVLLVGGLAFGAITPAEWIGVIVQALAAVGIAVTPNALEAIGIQQDAGDPPALPAASR